MKKFILFYLVFLTFHSYSKIWKVGKTRTYTSPSKVSTLVSNGDTVDIDSGLYTMDVAKWTATDLLLRGINGRARLDAQGKSYGDKAIWVIAGKNTKVENIEFFNCRVPDHNGAGIRLEAANLTVINCFFHHNEMGFLVGDIANCKLIVEHSEFSYNGYGDGYSHNIYVNHIDTFLFRYNYSHDADVGHEVKSRAYNNYILYNRISSEKGKDSRNIDLPNGGRAFIIGNIIEQGANSQNSNMIGFGLEGLSNPGSHKVFSINNTIVNKKNSGSVFDFKAGTDYLKAYNNIFYGTIKFTTGTLPNILDSASNISPYTLFIDFDNFDFNLTKNSTNALNKGTDPGKEGSFSLLPDKIYVHPVSEDNRCSNSTLDIGAYEYCSSVYNNSKLKKIIKIYPNPASDNVFIENMKNGSFKIFSINGELILFGNFNLMIDVSTIPAGIYLINIYSQNKSVHSRFIKN
ncbi:MAG: T9SS type A sorting domain-containing protein [Bacteroidia bacterium]|nr:T9SS type A sorting domain-containing protein [Bacteroidia bacterium]